MCRLMAVMCNNGMHQLDGTALGTGVTASHTKQLSRGENLLWYLQISAALAESAMRDCHAAMPSVVASVRKSKRLQAVSVLLLTGQ